MASLDAMPIRPITLVAAAVLLLTTTSSDAATSVSASPSPTVSLTASSTTGYPHPTTDRNAMTTRDLRTPGDGAAVVAPSSRFAWPVDPHHVLKRFDPPEVRWGSGHRGVDLGTSDRAAIHAPSDGVVTFSGTVADRGVLTLHHPEGFDTTYEPVVEQVAKGSLVHRGDVVAHLAPGPWHCTTPCLHWGYHVAKGEYRDPLTLIGTRRPILLPPL